MSGCGKKEVLQLQNEYEISYWTKVDLSNWKVTRIKVYLTHSSLYFKVKT